MVEHARRGSWRRWLTADTIEPPLDDDDGEQDELEIRVGGAPAPEPPAEPEVPSAAMNGANLRPLAARLELLASTVGSLRSGIDGYAETAAAAIKQTDEARQVERQRTDDVLAEVRTGLTTAGDRVQKLSTRLDGLAKRLATVLDEAVADRAAPVLAAVAGLDEQLKGLDGRLTALDERITALATPPEVDEHDAGDSVVLEALVRLDERLVAIDEHIGAADASAAVGEVATLRDVVARLAAAAEAPVADATAPVLAAVAELDERLSELDGHLEERLATSPAHGTAVLESLASLHEVVTQLAFVVAKAPTGDDLVTVSGTIAELEDHIAHLALQLTAVQGDDTVLLKLDALERQMTDAKSRPRALNAVARTVDEIRGLVEVVVDTMPASADHSADDLAVRVADEVVSRLDLEDLARRVAHHLEQTLEVVADPPG